MSQPWSAPAFLVSLTPCRSSDGTFYTAVCFYFYFFTVRVSISKNFIGRNRRRDSDFVQGTGSGGDCAVVDNNAVHAVADGGDARDGAGEAVRSVPRARAARVRGAARAVGGGAAAADG